MQNSDVPKTNTSIFKFKFVFFSALFLAILHTSVLYYLINRPSPEQDQEQEQEQEQSIIVSGEKEVGLHLYENILKKQKELNSTYFNQKVGLSISDKKITYAEFEILKKQYAQILAERKKSAFNPNDANGVISKQDALDSVKKEIMLHVLSQNDNLL